MSLITLSIIVEQKDTIYRRRLKGDLASLARIYNYKQSFDKSTREEYILNYKSSEKNDS